MKPIRGGLLSAVGAALLLLATAGTCWAAFPGANGLIAYSEWAGTTRHSSEIFTILPAGGDPTRLTDNAIEDTQPSSSADGGRLAFIRESVETDQNPNVWTMRADGTHQRQVTHGSLPKSSPSFSPGGGRIVMTRGWGIRGNIVILRTDGADSVRLTSGRAAEDPVFSPNGRRIVFSGAPREDGPRGIWVMRRDGTHKRLLAAEGEPDYSDPDFDPDGSHIVFHSLHNCISHGCDDSVILMRSDGRRKRAIGGERAPVFSPTGHRIAAVLLNCDDLTMSCRSTLVSFDRDGSHRHAVRRPPPPFDSVGGPSWQPISPP